MIDRLLAIAPSRFFLAVLVLVCSSYSTTLYSPPVLDDLHSFIENTNVYLPDLSLESIGKLADTKFGKARFIPIFSFALNHYFAHGDIFYYHATNIVIHLLATVALFFFLQALLRTPIGEKSLVFFDSPALFCVCVCALWALNPVQTNAVTYLVQRMTSMAALFYLAALACYTRARLTRGYRRILLMLGCWAAAGLAFLSKENSATLPVAILLVEFMFLSPDLGKRIWGAVRWYHWLFLVLVLALLLPLGQNTWQELTSGFAIRHFTMIERVLTQFRVVVFYISLLVLPLPGRLNLDHDFVLSTSWLTPATTLPCFLLLLALLGAGFLLRKQNPLIAFGIFWFFLNLVIESTFLPLELVFEHRLYLPSVGFFVAIMAIIDRFAKRLSPLCSAEARVLLLLAMIVLTAASSLLTTIRNEDWRDTLTIYEDCLEKSPNKSRTISNYGLALSREGRYEEAVVVLERAMAMGRPNDENYITSATNILAIYNRQKKFNKTIEKGEEFFGQISMSMNIVNIGKFMENLGGAYLMEGRYVDALDSYTTGLRYSPTWDYLARDLVALFHKARATEQGREVLGLSEDEADVYLKTAQALALLRIYEPAGVFLRKAEEISPTSPLVQGFRESYAELMNKNRIAEEQSDIANDKVYQRNGLFRFYIDAVRFISTYYKPLQGRGLYWLLSRAAAEAPDHPFVGLYLARWYWQEGRREEAVRLLNDILIDHPDWVPALAELGGYYYRLGKVDPAIDLFERVLTLNPGYHRWASYERILRARGNRVPSGRARPLAGGDGSLIH